MKKTLHKLLKNLGYEIRRAKPAPPKEAGATGAAALPDLPPDFDDFTKQVIAKAKPYTMTSPERMASLVNACEYVILNGIPGDFVECGVWRGGSALVMILTLQKHGVTDRDIHLFDTFDGMSEPTEDDVSMDGKSAGQMMQTREKTEEDHLWAYSPLEKVRELLEATGYPKERLFFYKGKVEDTVPVDALRAVSLLRLDTDWYESTKHELVHLYPLLAESGVLIIDDYGHWQGARKAVDEYFAGRKILLNRVDYTARIAVKP